jgi:hypothetical protein
VRVAGDERCQLNLPIEATGGDRLADGRPAVQLLAKAVPRKLADEEHACLAVTNFKLVSHRVGSLRSTCLVGGDRFAPATACVSKVASVKFLANLDLAGATLPFAPSSGGKTVPARGDAMPPGADPTRA